MGKFVRNSGKRTAMLCRAVAARLDPQPEPLYPTHSLHGCSAASAAADAHVRFTHGGPR